MNNNTTKPTVVQLPAIPTATELHALCEALASSALVKLMGIIERNDAHTLERYPGGFFRPYVPGEFFPDELLGCEHVMVVRHDGRVLRRPVPPFRAVPAYALSESDGDVWHLAELPKRERRAILRASGELKEHGALVLAAPISWQRARFVEQAIVDNENAPPRLRQPLPAPLWRVWEAVVPVRLPDAARKGAR